VYDVDIPLSEMIKSLRDELQSAQDDSAEHGLKFIVSQVDMELKIALSRKTKEDGRIVFGVINANGEVERKPAMVHTFKLSLKPEPTPPPARNDRGPADTQPVEKEPAKEEPSKEETTKEEPAKAAEEPAQTD
jgi:hypothetical protein